MNEEQATRWRKAGDEAAREARRVAEAGRGRTVDEARERHAHRSDSIIARRHNFPVQKPESER